MDAMLKAQYNTVLCQTKSSDGRFLFLGNIYGQIFVYSLEQICYYPEDEKKQSEIRISATEPVQIFSMSNKSSEIQSLSFYNEFLLVGTNGEISGFHWNEKTQKLEKKTFEIQIPATSGLFDVPDVNSLYLNKTEALLYAGCGDNIVHCISLDGGKILRNFSGHKDYIHCVDGSESMITSASEDGAIKIWDQRQKPATNTIEPYKNEDLNRTNYGKWQGTVSINDDWLVCGGGPRAALYHLRSLECTTIFPFPEKVHVSDYFDDTVLIGGEYNKFYHYNFNGDLKSEIPISSTCAYSIVWQQEPYKFLSIAGSSNKIDICTNFTYRDIILNLYKNTWSIE